MNIKNSVCHIFVFLLMCSACVYAAHDHELASNCLLAQSNIREFSLANRTDRAIEIKLTYFYHPDFDPDDHVSQIPTLVIPPEGLEPLDCGSIQHESHSLAVKGTLQKKHVIIRPYQTRREHSATLFQQICTIPAQSSKNLGTDAEGFYMGRLLINDPACMSYSKEGNEINFSISDDVRYVHDPRIFQSDLLNGGLNNALKIPFITKMLQAYERNGTNITDVLTKLMTLQTAGQRRIAQFRIDGMPTSSPIIPLITHTVMAYPRKTGEALFSVDQTRWFQRSMRVLPSCHGWRHVVWVSDASSITQADLGELVGCIELKSLSDICLNSETAVYLNQARAFLSDPKAWYHAANFYKYLILYTQGGLTRGLDTEITQPLTAFHQTFGFYASMECQTERMLASGLIASRTQHPAMLKALEIAHNTTASKIYAGDIWAEYYLGSGNVPRTIAIAQHGEAGKDMIFPANILNPSRTSKEHLHSDDPAFRVGSSTHANHYCEARWSK